MTTFVHHLSSFRPHRSFRRGFTFAEVLFAVILLGIGFIMLAGMFPVAISQSQSNLDETQAAAIAQAAASTLEQVGTNYDFEVTNHEFRPLYRTTLAGAPPGYQQLWDRVKYDAISDQDPRYAWSAVYRRTGNEHIAQIVVFVCKVQEYDKYTSADADWESSTPTPYRPGTYEPRMIHAVISDGGGEPDLIEFYEPADNSLFNAFEMEAEGCFVVVANDQVFNAGGEAIHPGEGSVYRVGIRRADRDGTNPPPGGASGRSRAYELYPGNDLVDARENIPPASNLSNPGDGNYTNHAGGGAAICYIVGRGWANPQLRSHPAAARLGGQRAQDVAVYTTFINIK